MKSLKRKNSAQSPSLESSRQTHLEASQKLRYIRGYTVDGEKGPFMTKQQLGCYAALGMLLLSPLGSAQDGGVSTALDRYNGPSLPRQGPTIDASLAQRLFRRGNTFSSLGRYKEAIDEYRKAISADPSFSDAIRNLANTYYFLENYEEAKPLLARYIELETQTTASLIAAVQTLGELERRSRNYESAIEYDERAIELIPDDDSQVHIMANTYNNNDYPDFAIRVYQAGVRAMPDNAFFDRSLGRLLEQSGRLEEALAAYRSAAAKDADSNFYGDLVENLERRLDRQ